MRRWVNLAIAFSLHILPHEWCSLIECLIEPENSWWSYRGCAWITSKPHTGKQVETISACLISHVSDVGDGTCYVLFTADTAVGRYKAFTRYQCVAFRLYCIGQQAVMQGFSRRRISSHTLIICLVRSMLDCRDRCGSAFRTGG